MMKPLILHAQSSYIGAQISLYYWSLMHNQWWLIAVSIKWMALHNRDMEVPSFHAIESMYQSAYQPIEGK